MKEINKGRLPIQNNLIAKPKIIVRYLWGKIWEDSKQKVFVNDKYPEMESQW